MLLSAASLCVSDGIAQTVSGVKADPELAAMRAIRQVRDPADKTSLDIKTYLRENPLAPPDTSSPRAALESYLLLMGEAQSIWRNVRSEFQESSNRFLTDEQEHKLTLVRALFEKAAAIFDLSDIPDTARKSASLEIVLQFQEILDRIYLPAMEDVPGGPAGSFLNSKAIGELPERWKIPGTDIVFEKTEMPGNGSRFLITGSSVDRIPEDYELIKSFPSRQDRGDDLYAYYIYTPGNLVAPKWYNLIRSGPDWLGNQVLSQAYWQWIALVLLTAITLAIPVLFHRWSRWRAVPLSDTRRKLRGLQMPVIVMLAVLAYRYLTEEQVNITGDVMIAVGTVSTAIVWTAMGWLAFRIVDLISAWIIKNPTVPTRSLDSSLLHTAFRLVGVAVAVLVIGYGATQIGIPVYGVIAGLGVGGLAVALAAQPTLENLIGGIILYADRMVRVGEFCEFDDLAGTIETIGIRSTRIRALDRTVITVSNADLAKRKIINYSRRDQFHLKHRITLRYETGEEQLKQVIAEIRSFLESHEMVAEEPLRVRLVELGAFSLDIEVYAYIQTSARDTFLEIQEDILMKIMEIVHESGTDFAFPSSTTYLAQDGGLPADSRKWIEDHASGADISESERQAG
ncbi:mechanosensitive ion channel family protein [Roseibium aggregatum]|uniref:Mechanosensitive ion channel n=1 Tax=Roseibium aggregatum TaxID=187304 RepID=A0A926S5M0_9HYPH|nr:mechanosensitive ion channel family protein [Roseibium aggregatum]MBD1546310.1 mechanosensitive ion channel [Roseibium aggregatum]